MTSIAVIGLGEAGRVYALGLAAAGADVRGYDWYARLGEPGIRQVDELSDAVVGSDLVISLVGAASALDVAAQALAHLTPGAVYADFNTADPALKRRIAALGDRSGIEVADVAVLAPVGRAGSRTPLLASGRASARVAALLSPLGVPLEIVEGEAGAAARLKLLRSVFVKGLAALVFESLDAARAAGVEPWMRGQIAGELGPDGDEHLDRLIAGTYRHAIRREQEMRDALAALEASGGHTDMTRATLTWLERIASDSGGVGSGAWDTSTRHE
jgi:3-hydroxyisobutyrate dehydrogenase-like beta-hydroxyacid dehydrogenase